MIFFVLNILLGCFFIWFAMITDVKSDEMRIRPIINISLNAAVISFAIAACILVDLFNNNQLEKILGSLTLFTVSLFSMSFFKYCIQFPSFEKKFFPRFVNTLLIAGSAYIILFQLETVGIMEGNGWSFSGKLLFADYDWFDLFNSFFLFVLPVISLLSLVLRMGKIKSKLFRQQIIVCIGAVLSCWALLKLLDLASQTVNPLYNTLFPFAFAAFVLMMFKAFTLSAFFDFSIIISSLQKFAYSFLVQSLLAGVIFALLLPLKQQSLSTFILAYLGAVFVLLFISYHVVKAIRSSKRGREADYARHFEDDLASLDYTENSTEVTERLVKILQENIDTSSVDVLIELNDKELLSVYSSSERKLSIRLDNPMFDVILNADHPVIFRSHIDAHHSLSGARKELQSLFDKTKADALVLLHGGRHIFGAIILGEKRLGNVFTDYDYKVFLELYSYFFVVGYYMMNIANEAIVGTVSRELQYSGQIIQSIQENVDHINNSKVDIGYLSLSAHNLGGEFIDFIRLTDDRYISVIGDLSGKGINASMSMVIVKSLIRTFLTETKDFKELVQKINFFIRTNLPKGTFMSGIFMLIDFSDNTLYYINCGIPALFMYSQAYNNVIEIQGDGRVLGFVKNIDKLLKVKKVKLNPGDIIFGCTDGLIESKSLRGESFGKERIQKSIMENLAYPADRMAQFMHRSLLEFTSKELEDDVSVLAIKYLSK
ncbi:MAG TPA: PP2C family protein-serine/threonine phosphatase [Treponemataceae bacterium]|nr:PP2C family protein-serine/threonine phosphatase [Treponemataceae bacterium]HQL04265.1 PP2C family protein-serine/threonine phosphatase [Treponemataceae bacterium]